MKYNFNGKEINIPDAEIEKNMKVLDISKDEAIEMWLDDNDYMENEEAEALTEKAKTVKRYEKSDRPRKKTVKERKVDEEKKRLLNFCRIPIEGAGGIITNIKNEAEFSFTFGENCYTVKLVKHRPPKK
jgi:predicted ATP-grasp superfamily ATP-dependent carboligase